jgi:hypothetical protein
VVIPDGFTKVHHVDTQRGSGSRAPARAQQRARAGSSQGREGAGEGRRAGNQDKGRHPASFSVTEAADIGWAAALGSILAVGCLLSQQQTRGAWATRVAARALATGVRIPRHRRTFCNSAAAPAGDVVALGDGKTMTGETRPFFLKEGQTVRRMDPARA